MRALSVSKAIPCAIGSIAILATSVAFASHQSSRPGQFTIDPKGAVTERFGYFPNSLALTADKPSGIKKEPTYEGPVKYGVIHLGNGPKSDFIVAVDMSKTSDWKVYIDKNQDGDLTNDGDGSWGKVTKGTGRNQYGVLVVDLKASYGSKSHESSSTPYTIGFYAFSNMEDKIFMWRQSAAEGTLEVGGKRHKAVLVENDGDGLYDKRVKTSEDAAKGKPVWLKIDMDDDGKYSSGIVDIRSPFKLGDQTYEAVASADGERIKLNKTNKPVLIAAAPKREPAPELLKKGAAAPAFTCEKWGGGSLSLADYKGKVVILDFWATWCGPCQKSMPHVESVKQKLAGQDVAVIGVCVWDDKDAYNKWVPENQSKYTFQFAFDPAGRDSKTSIAGKLFHVSGIPTTYIIDKDGNVADAIVGYDDNDTRLEKALQTLGVNVK